MQERRRSPRHGCHLRGRIYFGHGRKSVSCLIQDISYEGARITIFDLIDIPDDIKLCIPKKNRMVRAKVRWRHDNKIGLAFSEGQPDVVRKLPLRNIDDLPVPR
jgi:hypothetical protein